MQIQQRINGKENDHLEGSKLGMIDRRSTWAHESRLSLSWRIDIYAKQTCLYCLARGKFGENAYAYVELVISTCSSLRISYNVSQREIERRR